MRVAAELVFPNIAPIHVRLLDVGEGGVGVLTAVNPPPRLRCTVRFAIPAIGGVVAVEAQVCVVHSVLSGSLGGFVVGLQFTQIAPQAQEAILKFLRSR